MADSANEGFLGFLKGLEGKTLETLSRGAKFEVAVAMDHVDVTPSSSGRLQSISNTELRDFAREYRWIKSRRVSDYEHYTAASYELAIVSEYLTGSGSGEETHRRHIRPWTKISDSQVAWYLLSTGLRYCRIPRDYRSFFGFPSQQMMSTEQELQIFYSRRAYVAHRWWTPERHPDSMINLPYSLCEALNRSIDEMGDIGPEDVMLVFERSGDSTYVASLRLVDHNLDQYQNDCLVENGEFEEFLEGKKRMIYTTEYERSPRLRMEAILAHGLRCAVCGFDFGKTYGAQGQGYIEIHHLHPLCLNGGKSIKVNPATDLVPVCANCHRIMHRNRGRALSIQEVKGLLDGE
jgi:hypothetical protein